MRPFALLLLAACTFAADPLAAALARPDGDPFAADEIERVVLAAPAQERAAMLGRLDATGRADVAAALRRMVADADAQAAATAIAALARRWPTDLGDVALVREQIWRGGAVGDAAAAFAAAVGDDEALAPLADRAAQVPGGAAEQALSQLLSRPSGAPAGTWHLAVAEVESGRARVLEQASALLEGTPADCLAAITLIAGQRARDSRLARLLIAAASHPDATVRAAAVGVLATSPTPPAAVWRRDAQRDREGRALAAASAAPASGGGPSAGAVPPRGGAALAPPPPATLPPASAAAPAAGAAPAWLGWAAGLVVAAVAVAGLLVWRRSRPALPPPGPAGVRLTWTR